MILIYTPLTQLHYNNDKTVYFMPKDRMVDFIKRLFFYFGVTNVIFLFTVYGFTRTLVQEESKVFARPEKRVKPQTSGRRWQ